jgi:hypothetical protein
MRSDLVRLVGAGLLCGCKGVFPDCPGTGCRGTAWERHSAAQAAARQIDLDRPWSLVRDDLVQACGLKVQRSTGHCFNDFNHVDCCTMAGQNTHRTNEESRVVGMHRVNMLGPHIEDGSVAEHGTGGSWCTCHLSAPDDVCHKQFGAQPAFKLVWCDGTGVAALVDDHGNVLNSGKPTPDRDGNEVPDYGGARARSDLWKVLATSKNQTMQSQWRQSCDALRGGSDAQGLRAPAELRRALLEERAPAGDESKRPAQHDEL